MADYVSGTAGRVYVEDDIIAGIKSWRLDQTTAEIGIPHFESTVDALGRVWPSYLLGLSGATGTGEGQFLVGAVATDATITTGIEVVLSLIFRKSDIWGFGVTAIITAFGSGTNAENQPATFTFSFRVTGVVPLSSVVV